MSNVIDATDSKLKGVRLIRELEKRVGNLDQAKELPNEVTLTAEQFISILGEYERRKARRNPAFKNYALATSNERILFTKHNAMEIRVEEVEYEV